MSFLPKQTGGSLAIVAALFITTATGATAAEKPSWIWGAGAAKDNETVYFRKVISLNTPPQSAKLTLSCDNGFEAFVNGKKVLAGGDWNNARTADVKKHLNVGRNVIAVRGWNEGSVAGLVGQLDIAASTGLMYIVNFNLHGPMEPSTVSVVETRSMTEVARVETGVMPHGARLSLDGRRLYTVSMMDDELVELDALTFAVSRRLALADHVGGSHAGSDRAGMAGLVQPTWASRPTSQGKVYVTGNASNEIFEVDLDSWTITRRFEDTGAGPYNLDVTTDGRTLVVTYKNGAAVGFWDLESGRELGRVATLRTVPHGVTITPDSRYAFATIEGVGGEPGGVEVYDIETRERVGNVEIGKQAGGIAFWKTEP